MEILVFRTNIQEKSDIEHVGRYFAENKDIIDWNVDIEDDDKILRIEASSNIVCQIENIVKKAGFSCDELED